MQKWEGLVTLPVYLYLNSELKKCEGTMRITLEKPDVCTSVIQVEWTKAEEVSITLDGQALIHENWALATAKYPYKDAAGTLRYCTITSSWSTLFKYEALLMSGFAVIQGESEVGRCAITGYAERYRDLHFVEGVGNVISSMCTYYNGNYRSLTEMVLQLYRNRYHSLINFCTLDEYQEAVYCSECGYYVHPDIYNEEEDMCDNCVSLKYDRIIESYGESHQHAPIFFGHHSGTFKGLGFELEVETDEENSENNGKTAYNLINECGFEENELRYAHDGSLDYGFEIISQPHTVEEFWRKENQWCTMLDYLSSNGYTSHDTGNCGLHVHVSRAMFGKTQAEQDRAIAKVFSFFEDNWNDLVRVSRRNSFDYCDRNESRHKWNSKYRKWKDSIDCGYEGTEGHYVALNNHNSATFEYRLGRGTLNKLSFFSWIDLMLTITKNARRLSIGKVETNDKLSWLAGIKMQTATYILKRGAFRNEMFELFPSLKWDLSNEAE